jgi:dienelactone hydrolase
MARWVARALAGGAVVVVAVLGVGLVSALVYATVQSGRQVTLPAPTGPDRVGRTTYDWADGARTDPYAPRASTPRELSVWVWYPADPAPAAAPTTYWPRDWQQALAGSGGINALAHTSTTLIHPHAVEDAPLAADPPRHPVLVFAPGLGLQAADYTTVAEDLASHGFVVAGIDPTYSTDVVLSGGRVVRSVPAARDDADYARLVQVWADDFRFVAGRMQALDAAPGSPFQGHLQVDRIGFFGHSAGGAAAVLACRRDDRCPGAADIDGDPTGDVLHGGLGKPFLFLGHGGALARIPGLRSELHDVLQGVPPGDGHVLSVAGTGHDSFTDRAVSFNLLGRQLGFTGSIDGARALRITATYTRAFFDAALLGRPAPLLTGASPAYPEVQVEST